MAGLPFSLAPMGAIAPPSVPGMSGSGMPALGAPDPGAIPGVSQFSTPGRDYGDEGKTETITKQIMFYNSAEEIQNRTGPNQLVFVTPCPQLAAFANGTVGRLETGSLLHPMFEARSLSSLNEMLASYEGRRKYGGKSDCASITREWTWAGVQITNFASLLGEFGQYAAAVIVGRRAVTPNIWAVSGTTVQANSYLWLVLRRYKYNPELVGSVWTPSIHSKDGAPTSVMDKWRRDRSLAESKRGPADALDDLLEGNRVSRLASSAPLAELVAEASPPTATADEYYWRYDPMVTASAAPPSTHLYAPGEWIGHLIYVGRCTDLLPPYMSAPRARACARLAVFPETDNGVYKQSLYGMPELEIQIRCR